MYVLLIHAAYPIVYQLSVYFHGNVSVMYSNAVHVPNFCICFELGLA